MNILYFSVHSVLENMEVSLFTEMGHNVFSLGVYQGNNQGSNLRGAIPNLYQNQHLIDVSLMSNKDNIHPELLEWCDLVVMMHNSPILGNTHPQPWLAGNWKQFKESKKPIIWRSIGQSAEGVERSLEPFRKEGLKIIRYSPKEANIPSYQGSDALIRFHIDPGEYSGYTGITPRLVNISQALYGNLKHGGHVPSRGDHMNLEEFKRIVEGFDWKVFGPDNEDAEEHNGGQLPLEDLKAMLKFSRAFISLGTRPASYTLGFMEAMCLGIPIIAIGPKMANHLYGIETYEVHEIIGTPGEAGFWSDDLDELREFCRALLEDQGLAKTVGAKGRERAISYFAKEPIKEQWRVFFKSL